MPTFDKVGLVFRPNRNIWWSRSHAMNPLPVLMDGENLVKVYYAGRDDRNRSHIGWVVLDTSTWRVVDQSAEPVLSLGELGTFDDNGVTPISLVVDGSMEYLYYVGFKPGGTTRTDLFGGLAIRQIGEKKFIRHSKAPILERNSVNPYMNTGPFVLKDGDQWRMYYVAGCGWIDSNTPKYNIMYASSYDGLNWRRDGQVCIDFIDDSEFAIAKPWVVKNEGRYHMWYSTKGKYPRNIEYQIGYAESLDGQNWVRMDSRAGIYSSNSGWDSEMIEYAAVLKIKGTYYMFYNGNNYGIDGFGVALTNSLLS